MSTENHPDDQSAIEKLHVEFINRFDRVNDDLMAFQDKAYAMGRARGLLDAERQVGELREQLNKFECATDAEEATALAAFDASAEEGHQYDLESFTAGYDRAAFKAQRKLDEAETLLRDIDKNSWSLAGREAVRLDAYLNTTSTEGKDHD